MIRPVKSFRTLFLVILSLALSCCSGILPPPVETATVTVLPSATLTVVWFPATNTATTFPTATTVLPTPEMRPVLEALLFEDTFNDPALWNLSSSAPASAAINFNRLVLTVNGPGPLRILSLRSGPVLGDFYAEADASLSLCNAEGQFGLVFRADSGADHYRFTVRCSGQARLERVQGGQTVTVMEWQASGDAPVGAPSEVRLGVWASGKELSFFLNDHYQFSLRDPVYSRGKIGFFAFTGGESSLAVSFSDLRLFSVPPFSPSSSQTPTRTPIPPQQP